MPDVDVFPCGYGQSLLAGSVEEKVQGCPVPDEKGVQMSPGHLD